jgi:hypothetical protein
VLTEDRRSEIRTRARAAIGKATLRSDSWWAFPAWIAFFLTTMIAYSTWAGLQSENYFVEPYLSPIFSPCLAALCEHGDFRVLGEWFTLPPAILVIWLPISFRITCYYYRKVYYRAMFFAPPACAVAEPWPKYRGETRFPHVVVQNLHRYFFYLMIGNLFFLYWDTVRSFIFADGFGVGVGTLFMVGMIATMTLYMLSCHSCRHVFGGQVDVFSKAPLRYRMWRLVSRLNQRHGIYALSSMFMIPFTDLYIRLVAAGVITDFRLI